MNKMTPEQYAERGAELIRTKKSGGWSVICAEYRRVLAEVEREALDTETPAARTEALKEARAFLLNNSPEEIAERLIRESRSNS